MVSVDVKLYTEPCSRTGLSMSLTCQPTSEDTKQNRKKNLSCLLTNLLQSEYQRNQWCNRYGSGYRTDVVNQCLESVCLSAPWFPCTPTVQATYPGVASPSILSLFLSFTLIYVHRNRMAYLGRNKWEGRGGGGGGGSVGYL